jgi:MtrB/PioB family decaheme-associated outer membrane protein
VLTLPAGFPAPSTAAMPLAGTLQPVDIGYKRSRYDLRASWLAGEDWTHRISLRHDVRDGTQRIGGSFFSSASQLVAPLDQVTDQLELATAYNGRRVQASLAYSASLFRNGPDSLTWSNPFTTGIIGSASGQLALAPDNQFHQILASLGYEVTPKIRTSFELAVGRMTQDAPFLPATLNPTLGVPALPAASLHGRADTLNASARISAEATERLRLTGSVSRDERDNRTPTLAWPAVSTDMFVGVNPRINQPYSFTDDRIKLGGDYRGPGAIKASFGLEHDTRHRTLQETDATREATVWVRVSTALRPNVSLALKLAHAERDNSDYRVVPAIDPAENPLLRKFNQAQRSRDVAGLRSDIAISESINIGLSLDVTNDDYRHSLVGLTDGRSIDVGADLALAVSDETQLRLYAQGERIRSRQAGSQLFGQPDWFGRTRDAFDVLGVGFRHLALKGKLQFDGDLTVARSRSRISVETGASSPPFPTAATARDTLKLGATYRLRDDLSLIGSWWYERYDAQDWRLDGVLPDTVPNLLALGQQPPRYHVNVFALVLRYRFK